MFGGSHPRPTRRLRRTAVATLGAAALLAAYTGTASADPAENTSDTHAKATASDAVTGKPTPHSVGIIFDDSNGEQVDVSRFDLALSTGQTAITYCIDLTHELANGKTYVEGNWDKANPQSDMASILWVLDHSGPLLPAADVLAAAGVPTADFDHPAKDLVYMATQAAVWHLSDGFDLGDQQPLFGGHGQDGGSPDEADAIQAVYDYLTGSANTGATEPAPTLSITPGSMSGQVGEPIGPFTVHTTAKGIKLDAPDGVQFVLDAGKPVDSVNDGTKFSVVLDQPGTVTVHATGTGTVPTGRVFVFQKSPDEKQKLVVATPSPVEVSAEFTVTAAEVAPTATPSPRPRPELAATGASPWPKVGLGVLLLVVGAGLTLLARRRRTS